MTRSPGGRATVLKTPYGIRHFLIPLRVGNSAACPEGQTVLNGNSYFDIVKGRQMKGVRLSCPWCEFSEI
jgi:hypothetical protein